MLRRGRSWVGAAILGRLMLHEAYLLCSSAGCSPARQWQSAAVVTITSEHTAFERIDIDDAASRLMWPSDRQAVEEVL
ncbi:MAG: hypothetical protein GX998_10030 [Firmicutes bacterium]|nr:hypothetical protein [Bacillota bacterium]